MRLFVIAIPKGYRSCEAIPKGYDVSLIAHHKIFLTMIHYTGDTGSATPQTSSRLRNPANKKDAGKLPASGIQIRQGLLHRNGQINAVLI